MLDLSDRKLYFKVRGRAFKALTLDWIEVRRGARPIDPEELSGRAYTLQLKEGKGVETESITMKSLTPDEAARAGGSGGAEIPQEEAEQGAVVEDPEPAGRTAGTGAPPATQKMAGVAGGSIPPDPPPRYHLGFDAGLSMWVDAETAPHAQSSFSSWLLPIAKRIGRLLGRGGEEAEENRITLHVTLDRGQQLFRQIIPGEQLLISP